MAPEGSKHCHVIMSQNIHFVLVYKLSEGASESLKQSQPQYRVDSLAIGFTATSCSGMCLVMCNTTCTVLVFSVTAF